MKVLYARVSTDEQNTSRQEEIINKYNIEKVFIEKKSGKNKDREELNNMLNYVREGDILYCLSIDRLGRNLKDLLEIIDMLKEKKVIIHFEKENIEFNNKENIFNDLVFNIFSSIAEFERKNILDRQKAGIEKAKQDGKYSKSRNKPTKLSNEIIKDIKNKIDNNLKSISDIAKEYNISRQTIYNYIR